MASDFFQPPAASPAASFLQILQSASIQSRLQSCLLKPRSRPSRNSGRKHIKLSQGKFSHEEITLQECSEAEAVPLQRMKSIALSNWCSKDWQHWLLWPKDANKSVTEIDTLMASVGLLMPKWQLFSPISAWAISSLGQMFFRGSAWTT